MSFLLQALSGINPQVINIIRIPSITKRRYGDSYFFLRVFFVAFCANMPIPLARVHGCYPHSCIGLPNGGFSQRFHSNDS